MLIKITGYCEISGRNTNGIWETRFYDEDEIIDCILYTEEDNQYPTISDNNDGFISPDVPTDLYEIAGEPLKIKFLEQLEFDDDGDTATEGDAEFKRIYSVGEIVDCLAFGYVDDEKMVDLEFADGAVFTKVNTEIYNVIE